MTMDVGTCSPSAALLRREPPNGRPVSSTIPLERYYSTADRLLKQANPRPIPTHAFHPNGPCRMRVAARPRWGLATVARGLSTQNALCVLCACVVVASWSPHACDIPWFM
jgi:hypothetical protein